MSCWRRFCASRTSGCLLVSGLLAAQLRILTEAAFSASDASCNRAGVDVCHAESHLGESRSSALLQASTNMQRPASRIATSPRENRSSVEPPLHLRNCVLEYADGLDSVQRGLGKNVRKLLLQPRKLSQRAVVFGAGSGTTATRSLHAFFKELGLQGWHFHLRSNWTLSLLDALGQTENDSGYRKRSAKGWDSRSCHATLQSFDYTSLPDDVDYVLDTPADHLFIHLFLSYPKAKFILTTRPLLEWAKRRRQHKGALAPIMDPCGRYIEDFPKDPNLAKLEDLKRGLVRCAVPKNRLFEFSVFAVPEEWKRAIVDKLASFIGIQEPKDKYFPTRSTSAKVRSFTLETRDAALGKLFGNSTWDAAAGRPRKW